MAIGEGNVGLGLREMAREGWDGRGIKVRGGESDFIDELISLTPEFFLM